MDPQERGESVKRPVVLDTDISALCIKRQLSPAWHARLLSTKPYMTFVTRGELLRWTRLRQLGRHQQSEAFTWIANSVFLPGNAAVAEAYGELTAEAKRRGRRGPDNDTWIAACCVSKRLPLATLNVKDSTILPSTTGLS
jgi:predicted nucleic acid-binding protein